MNCNHLLSTNSGQPNVDDLESLVLASFLTVTPEDYKGWISNIAIIILINNY